MRPYLFSILATLALVCLLSAQSSETVIVQAAPQRVTAKAAPVTSDSNSGQALLKMLQEMKAANEETLRKQAAELDQLAELEKVANEIKLYTRRS